MPKTDLIAVEAERNRLNKILSAAKQREERAANKKLLGKCFVYMNTYGVADDMKRWPLYVFINRMNRNGTLYGLKFESSSRDRIEIETNYYCHHVSPGNEYREITRAEFNKALRALKAQIAKL